MYVVAVRQAFAADALLGRFLPRLGPLVETQAASFVSAASFFYAALKFQRVEENAAGTAGPWIMLCLFSCRPSPAVARGYRFHQDSGGLG